MSFNILSRLFPIILLILSLASPPASGKPLPPQAVNSPTKAEARSLIGDGGLKPWEIVVLVLGSVVAIMLIGSLGGACEVMMHTRSKMVQSNAEADAKAESGGNRALETIPAEDKEGGSGSDASAEVDVVDASRFSWQPEKMTAGRDISEDRARWEADSVGSSGTTLNGEQSSVDGGNATAYGLAMDRNMPAVTSSDVGFHQEQTRDRILPWEDHSHLDPALSQFVIGDEENNDYGEDAAGYGHPQHHPAEPVAMPDHADFQHENMTTHYPQQEAQAVASAGDYSGEGYSPAVMPDEVDYLAEYRQSQQYLQQDDDWQQYYGQPHGTSETHSEQSAHETQAGVEPQPDPGYF